MVVSFLSKPVPRHEAVALDPKGAIESLLATSLAGAIFTGGFGRWRCVVVGSAGD
jgi:hypothetical protein